MIDNKRERDFFYYPSTSLLGSCLAGCYQLPAETLTAATGVREVGDRWRRIEEWSPGVHVESDSENNTSSVPSKLCVWHRKSHPAAFWSPQGLALPIAQFKITAFIFSSGCELLCSRGGKQREHWMWGCNTVVLRMNIKSHQSLYLAFCAHKFREHL